MKRRSVVLWHLSFALMGFNFSLFFWIRKRIYINIKKTTTRNEAAKHPPRANYNPRKGYAQNQQYQLRRNKNPLPFKRIESWATCPLTIQLKFQPQLNSRVPFHLHSSAIIADNGFVLFIDLEIWEWTLKFLVLFWHYCRSEICRL